MSDRRATEAKDRDARRADPAGHGRSRLVHRRRTPVGTPPGTLLPDVGAAPSAIRMTEIAERHATVTENASVEDVARAMKAGHRLWVDVVGLADLDMLSALGALFSIDALALEDIVNTHQRPKVDLYEAHALIVVHMFDGVRVASKEQFSILFDRHHVLTFQERPGDCLDPVRRRLAATHGRIRARGSAYLVYALLDTVVDAYFPLLEAIGDRLEEIDRVIADDPHPGVVTDLHDLKRELLVVKRALWPSREMLSALTRGDLGLIPRDVHNYLRDIYDHAVQLIDMVETYRELATSLLELYLSSVSTRMNEVMKVLTIVATIFIPLTFLAGIWGMNFERAASPWNMPELAAYYGYPFALGTMVATALGLIVYFRWKRWL